MTELLWHGAGEETAGEETVGSKPALHNDGPTDIERLIERDRKKMATARAEAVGLETEVSSITGEQGPHWNRGTHDERSHGLPHRLKPPVPTVGESVRPGEALCGFDQISRVVGSDTKASSIPAVVGPERHHVARQRSRRGVISRESTPLETPDTVTATYDTDGHGSDGTIAATLSISPAQARERSYEIMKKAGETKHRKATGLSNRTQSAAEIDLRLGRKAAAQGDKWVVHPNDSNRNRWEGFTQLLVIYNAIEVPLVIGFHLKETTWQEVWPYCTVTVLHGFYLGDTTWGAGDRLDD